METDILVSVKCPPFCRICFSYDSELFDLASFLPALRLIAQTKITSNDDGFGKICSSCANQTIMANMFRVKVIESNGKYNDFLQMENIKKEQEEETLNSIETDSQYMKNDSIDYDDPMSDDGTQVEFLNDFLNAVKAAENVQVVNAPPKKVVKQEVFPVYDKNNSEMRKRIRKQVETNEVRVVEEPICFICTEPAQRQNILTPFKDTINRIVHVQNYRSHEYLCQKCVKKLADSKLFFSRLDQGRGTTIKKDCCRFCLNKVFQIGKIPKTVLETFKLLHISGHDSKTKEDARICTQCIQLLKRIRVVRNLFNAKERFYQKKYKDSDINVKERNTISKGRKKESCEAHIYDENFSTFYQKQKPLKRLRLRLHPKYVKPDPNKPISEDYQCHMSDFEDIESDTEVPPVPFRSPLNVPFQHKYLHCPDCHLKFVNSCEMEAHHDVIHGTTCEVCDVCQKAFKDLRTVKEHKLAVHTTEFSAFNFRKLCDICGLVKRKFENHYAIHFDVRAFKCQLCSCDYKTKISLEDHIRTVHMREKRHRCGYCDKRFSYAADKARHEIGVHTKKFKHICQFCGKCFLKKNFLTAHQKSQHADMLLELNNQSQE